MYARILVPIDGSLPSEAGVSEAIRLARLCGGQIRLMHLVDDTPPVAESSLFGETIPNLTQAAREGGTAMLERAKSRVSRSGVPVDTRMTEGHGARLVDFINRQVDDWHADIIVLGTHGRHGLGRALLGSDAEQIVRHASVPVLLVRREAAPKAELPSARTAEGSAS
jgi:nucleotide-binding universal stress UspA family protein